MDYEYWLSLSEPDLAKQDIAKLSLIFANGLPPTGILDIDSLLQRLHQWTQQVRTGTKKLLKMRPNLPQYQHYSDSQFRIAVMITILQRDIGLRYNAAFAQGDYDASDSRNLFIHGLFTAFGGTCNTLPVLYAAIGRRLGLSDPFGLRQRAYVLPLGKCRRTVQHRGYVYRVHLATGCRVFAMAWENLAKRIE